MAQAENSYYVPHGSHWPIFGSVAVCTLLVGMANYLNGTSWGGNMALVGFGLLVIMLFGWFGTVVKESRAGLYNTCLLYTSPSPRDKRQSRMPSSA